MPDHRHAELCEWLHSQVTGLGSEDPAKYGRMITFAKIKETATAIDELHAENARLREAMEWYADPEVYRPSPHGPHFDDRDLSWKARKALEAHND